MIYLLLCTVLEQFMLNNEYKSSLFREIVRCILKNIYVKMILNTFVKSQLISYTTNITSLEYFPTEYHLFTSRDSLFSY